MQLYRCDAFVVSAPLFTTDESKPFGMTIIIESSELVIIASRAFG
jgi:hypothetical protein